MADEACHKAARELEDGRKARGKALAQKQAENFARRRAERADTWIAQLTTQVRLAGWLEAWFLREEGRRVCLVDTAGRRCRALCYSTGIRAAWVVSLELEVGLREEFVGVEGFAFSICIHLCRNDYDRVSHCLGCVNFWMYVL